MKYEAVEQHLQISIEKAEWIIPALVQLVFEQACFLRPYLSTPTAFYPIPTCFHNVIYKLLPNRNHLTEPVGHPAPCKPFFGSLWTVDCFHSHLTLQIQAHFLGLLCFGMEVSIDSLLLSPVSVGGVLAHSLLLTNHLFWLLFMSLCSYIKELLPHFTEQLTMITVKVWLWNDYVRIRAKERTIDRNCIYSYFKAGVYT